MVLFACSNRIVSAGWEGVVVTQRDATAVTTDAERPHVRDASQTQQLRSTALTSGQHWAGSTRPLLASTRFLSLRRRRRQLQQAQEEAQRVSGANAGAGVAAVLRCSALQQWSSSGGGSGGGTAPAPDVLCIVCGHGVVRLGSDDSIPWIASGTVDGQVRHTARFVCAAAAGAAATALPTRAAQVFVWNAAGGQLVSHLVLRNPKPAALSVTHGVRPTSPLSTLLSACSVRCVLRVGAWRVAVPDSD